MITLFGPRAAPIVIKVARGLGLKHLEFTLSEPRSTEDYWRWSPETGRGYSTERELRRQCLERAFLDAWILK